jgi:hypothetical protein
MESFKQTTDRICCEDGEAYSLNVAWGLYSSSVELFCGNLKIGAECGDDRMCGSGLFCIEEECTDQLLADGSECVDEFNCENRIVCAKASFKQNAGKICCEGGVAYSLNVPWGDYSSSVEWFCGNLPNGTTCGDDRMCGSQLFCIEGECVADQRLSDGS